MDQKWLDDGIAALLIDLPLAPGVPGGMEKYRQSLALSFLFKFYTEFATAGKEQLSLTDISERHFEATQIYRVTTSVQCVQASVQVVMRIVE